MPGPESWGHACIGAQQSVSQGWYGHNGHNAGCVLLQQAKAKDMRVALAETIPPGTVLYKVSVRELQDADAEDIGTLETEGPMVASKFGDESLFFKHMRLR